MRFRIGFTIFDMYLFTSIVIHFEVVSVINSINKKLEQVTFEARILMSPFNITDEPVYLPINLICFVMVNFDLQNLLSHRMIRYLHFSLL